MFLNSLGLIFRVYSYILSMSPPRSVFLSLKKQRDAHTKMLSLPASCWVFPAITTHFGSLKLKVVLLQSPVS